MPPSTASKRFRSATANLQGRAVGSKGKAPATPSITTLVPDVLQNAGPRMTVAAKRNIFMHARAYLQGQSHVKDMNERKRLVQSVVEGTRLHQKQGEAVTSLQDNVVEKQEERQKTKEALEAKERRELEEQRLAEAALEAEALAYHAANGGTLRSVGVLHSQVAKLEALVSSYQETSLIKNAVASAQNCVGLLSSLKAQIRDDEDMLEYIRESQKAGKLSASLMHDLEGEIARMREALEAAKAQSAEPASGHKDDVLELVGSIYEDMLRLQLSSLQLAEVPDAGVDARPAEQSPGESAEAVAEQPQQEEELLARPEDEAPTERSETTELPAAADAAHASEAVEEEFIAAEEAEAAEAAETAEETAVAEEELADEEPAAEAEVESSPAALPSLAATLPAEPSEDAAAASPALPRLDSQQAPETREAELPVAGGATALPTISEVADPDSSGALQDSEKLPEPSAPAAPPDAAGAEVRKVRRRKLIPAPEVRLPPLSSRNRKNTADLDWNMEHLNQAELNLLNSLVAEDGVSHAHSVAYDPRKERLWKQVWGLDDTPRRAAAEPERRREEWPPVAPKDLRPKKVRTLPERSRPDLPEMPRSAQGAIRTPRGVPCV